MFAAGPEPGQHVQSEGVAGCHLQQAAQRFPEKRDVAVVRNESGFAVELLDAVSPSFTESSR